MLATQNPIEYEGTYPLPEAQLDRFLLRHRRRLPGARARVGDARAPDRAGRGRGRAGARSSTGTSCSRCSARSSRCTSRSRSGYYMVDLVAATRTAPGVQVGASPRGSLALLKLSRCRAALAGRDYVTPDDVKAVAVPALAHRLALRPELWVRAPALGRHRPRACSTACRRRRSSRPRPRPRASDARGDRQARRLRRPRRRSGCSRRSRSAGRSSPRSRRRSRSSLAAGLALARARRGAGVARARPRAPARGRGTSRSLLEVSASRPVEHLELLLDLPDEASSPRRRTRSADPPRPGERRELELPLRCTHWGDVPGRERSSGAPGTGSASSSTREGSTVGPPAQGLPARRDAPAAAAPARDAGLRRQPGRAHPRRGDRVRRPAAVHARRPRAARQLARDRAPRRAVGERDASGAELGRRRSSSTRSPRRRRRELGTLDLAVRAAALARRALPPREGPRRARRLRRRPQLADRDLGRDRRSSTGSSTRCSTRRSCSATRGRTST